MKESYSFLRTWLKPFAVTLAFIYSPQLTLAADIDIATSFPDAKVQEVLLTYDTSGEGILQESEQTFTSLDLSNKGVTNLKGVELLTQLTSLYVNGNADLKSISIKKLINLKNLSVQGTGLTSLDISGLTEITNLYAYDCPNLATITADGCTSLDWIANWSDDHFPALTTLSLKNTGFTSFTVQGENIESVDLSNCTKLASVYATKRKELTSLKVDGCSELTSLTVSENEKLATLIVSNLEKLTSLTISNSPAFESLTLKGLTALTTFDAKNTLALTSFSVSEMPSLKTLYLQGTGLTSLDISDLTEITSLYAYDCPNLATITADGCTSLDWIANWSDDRFPALTTLSFKNTGFTSFTVQGENIESVDLSDCTKLASVYVSNREKLTTLTLDGCTALTTLSMDKLALMTSYDVSNLTTLENWTVSNCPLMECLNFGEGKALNSVTINNNEKLETLTVVSPTLTNLTCSYNSLKSLDVTQCPELTSLNCQYNRLTSLDLSKNTMLTWASTYQKDIVTDMVYLSATEVGFALSPDFDSDNVVELKIDGEKKDPKFTVVDGVKYFVIYDNVADAEEALKDKTIQYGYDTGLAGYPLNNKVVITGYTKAPSFLTVDPTSVKGVYGATLVEPTLTRSQDYDGTVTYKSGNAKVVKVASDGNLTVVGAGETTVTISGAESTYRLAPEDVTYSVTIEKASPKFKFAKAIQEMIISDEVPENALDKGVYDGTVVYESSDEKVAKIASDGKITIVAAGEVTFTASGAATNNCNEPTAASYKLTIKKCTATMTVDPTAVEGVYGGKVTAPKLDNGGYDGTLKYESSDANVVKVSSKGALTVVGAGNATITISGAETAQYYATQVTYTATIAKADVTFSYEEESLEMFLKSEVPANKLNKGIYDGIVTYKSSDTNVATIAADGTITVQAAGTVKFTASGAATNNCNKPTAASYTLTIMLPGDINNDGKVDDADFKLISDCIMSDGYDKKYDLNGDNKVNAADLVELANMAKIK